MSKPQVSTLKNGLTVITQYAPGEQVYGNVTVNVGYRHERPDQDNMAHFLEHLANLGKFENKLERTMAVQNRRGTTNASTNSERTDYKLQLSKEFSEDVVEMLGGRMLNMRFEEEFLKAERNSVEVELRSGVDKPSMINYQRILQTAFPDSQLDKDRFQTVDTVQNHDLKGLHEFKTLHYTADNMTLAMVGDVKHEDVVAWAERHFDGLTPTNDAPRKAPPAVYRGGMKTYVNPSAPEVNLYIAFEGTGRKDPQEAAVDQVLGAILGAGSSSRLNRTLVDEKRIARNVGATTNDFPDNGLFLLSATTTADSVKDTIDTLAAESLNLAGTVTQSELDKV
ncbi:MAG: insulinase family protein, partial [Alphaproteobacteria bacterium]|nr:insulinase family protein [Alphaproteobacteria bacterium]